MLVFLLLVSYSSFAQGSDQFQELTAVRMQKELIQKYLDGPQLDAFTINKEGVLRPTKDYHIIYNKKKGILVLKPKKEKSLVFTQGGYDEIELPGGHVAACFCSEGQDDCMFQISDNPQTPFRFVCEGTCGCGVGIIFKKRNPPAEYETPGGDWFNF